MKIAVVTCSYIPKGRIEFNTPIRSVQNPDSYQYHNEDKYETLMFTLAAHKHYKPGMDYDLFVVDNTSDDKSIDWVEQYCSENDVSFERRENMGFSFGAFRYAFWKYNSQYDYFLFHEQDFAPAKDGWLKEMFDFFHSEENVGAIGNCVEGPRSKLSPEAEGTYKLYPELGDTTLHNLDQLAFVKTDILRKCIERYGWRLINWTPETDGDGSATINELSFTVPIFLSGYKLKGFMNEHKYVATNGICVMDERPWEIELPDERVAPMVLIHSRFFHPRFKRLFSWYENKI